MFTYLIGWSKYHKYYYGVKFANGATPDCLFTTYFTSSKYVKNFMKAYGRPDIIQIRKYFTSKQKARDWEHKVLRRLKAAKSEKWLNQTDNKAIYRTIHNPWNRGKTYKRNKPAWNKGLKTGPNKKVSEYKRGRDIGIKNWNNGITQIRSYERPGEGWMHGRLDDAVNKIPIIFRDKEYASISLAKEDTGCCYQTIKKFMQPLPSPKQD